MVRELIEQGLEGEALEAEVARLLDLGPVEAAELVAITLGLSGGDVLPPPQVATRDF